MRIESKQKSSSASESVGERARETTMETEAAAEGWLRRREHRNGGGRFRAEIEMYRGSAIPSGPGFGFAAAVREPLVRLQRPKYDFERWNWDYFAWPHDRLDANLEMRDGDPDATLEADRKASESFLNRNMRQLESYEMFQHTLEQHAAAWPRNRLNDAVNLEMRNGGPEATPEADRKAKESFLCRSTPQLKRREMDQHTQEQHKEEEEKENEEAVLLRTPMFMDKKPVGRRATRRRRVFAEANRVMECKVPGLVSHTNTHPIWLVAPPMRWAACTWSLIRIHQYILA